MPPRQDGFEGGGGEYSHSDSTFIEKALAVAVGVLATACALGPDIVHLAIGTLANP